MAFLGGRVAVVEGDDAQRLGEEADVERNEDHVQREFAVHRGQVPCTQQVDAVVINVQSTRHTFERCSAVSG